MKKIQYLLLLLGFVAVSSCQPKKNLNYLQDIDEIATEEAMRLDRATLQPGDQIVATVMARDNDVAKPFNQNYSAGQVIQNPQISGNATPAIPTVAGPMYIVDSEYDIDFPILGKINVRGLTVDGFKTELVNRLKRYIKEPTVSLQMTNFKVSVMGDVNRPGEFTLPDGKGTLLSALSMAGDLTIYGNREDVLVIRNIDGKLEKSKVDLTKSDFFTSPFYNLRQGDVIYVSSNETKQKSARLDPNAGIYISVASIVVTILALVFKK